MDGMQAALTLKKLVPSIMQDTKEGISEKRQIALKGHFKVFVKGQSKGIKLPVKIEIKDEPAIVQLIQNELNVQNIGEKCLVILHGNKQGRLDTHFSDLEARELKQRQLYPDPAGSVSQIDEEEE